MASRYNGGSDQRPPPPRDRSPPRFADRRLSSNIYSSSQSNYGPRGNDDAGLGREPPRGPKALVDQPRHSSFAPSGPRGRGYGPARDFGDRDRFRDRNDPPPFRRDSDRPGWDRRDREPLIRDNRPPLSREKSRSPPPLGRKDLSRPSPPSASDSNYIRRDSKDFSSGPPPRDGPPSWTSRGGGFRGRGRGDWDGSRGRNIGDRGNFRTRSRSREGWYDRDADREADFDRRGGFDRRESDRSADREDRERDTLWQKDRPLGPTTPGSVAGSLKIPLATPSHSRSAENSAAKPPYESARRFSSSLTTPTHMLNRKEGEKTDYFSSKLDPPSRNSAPRPASPQAAPQVPAFGAPLAYLGASQPSAVAKPATTEKPAPSQKPVAPSDPIPATAQTTSAPMQPPAGPRAQREPPPLSQTPTKPSNVNQPVKEEEKPVRPPTGPSAIRVDAVPSGPRAMTGLESRDNSGGLFQNVPTGPKARTTSTSSLRPDPPIGLATSPRTTFAAPPRPYNAGPPSAAPFSAIPTGPRAQRLATAPKQHQWVSKEYAQKQQQQAPVQASPPTAPVVDLKDKLVNGFLTGGKTLNDVKDSVPDNRVPAQDQSMTDVKVAEPAEVRAAIPDPVETDITKMEKPASPAWGLQESASDNEQDDLGFDEEDFATAEARFQQEQQKRAARKPPAPIDDPIVRELLIKIQVLGMIAAGDVPGEFRQEKKETANDDTQMADADAEGDIEPKEESPPPEDPVPVGRPLKEKPQPTTETPPVEELPFRTSGPPTPFSEFGIFDENFEKRDKLQASFRNDFEKHREENGEKNQHLKEKFREYYKPWRREVTELDKKRKTLEKPLTPAPASPTLSVGVLPLTTPGGERRRGERNASELEFEKAIRLSEETAKQEQDRRDAEAKRDADYDREAVVPGMIDNFDRDEDNFNDTNQLIPADKALETFGFVPPRDDFDEAEQEKFIAAFIEFPKKWGRIASFIDDRDFQACILHYYLTKKDAGYKDILRRNQTRKGRRKGPKGGAKSNALMADLGVRPDAYDGDEFNHAPAVVTESGRPRRAAAPVFGEKEAAEDAATGKRGAASKDATTGEATAEKPAKGRKTGTRTRRTKAQIQQAQQLAAAGQSPLKTDKEPLPVIKAGRAKDVLSSVNVPLDQTATPPPDMPQLVELRGGDSNQPQMYPIATIEGDPQQNPLQNPYPGAAQASSYWSVPEQKDFPKLLAHFGKDFEAIATYMRTKTANMVKNYYVRQCDLKPELETIVADAESKKRRGIQTGPLPMPASAPKRKYDATPSAVAPRPLAPSTDTGLPFDEMPREVIHRPLVEEPALPPSHVSPPREQMRPAPPQPIQSRPPPIPNPLAAHPRVEESYQQLRAPPSMTRPDTGPRRGFFTEERHESRQPANATPVVREMPPAPTVERMRAEPSSRHQSFSAPRVSIPSAQAQYSVPAPPPTQQDYMQRMPVQGQSAMQHARNISSGGLGSPAQTTLKHEVDAVPPVALRRGDSQSYRQPYAGSPAQSPIIARPVQPIHISREPSRQVPTPAPPQEPPRVTPAKRSNIMSILNDEPSEPAPKRPSTEQMNIHRIPPSHTPSPRLTHQSHAYPQTLHPRPQEQPHPSLVQQQQQQQQQQQHRTSYTGPSSMHRSPMQPNQSLAEYPTNYRGDSGPSPASRDPWIARYDPRGQHNVPTPTAEPPPPQRQLPASPYASAVPPQHHASPRLNPAQPQAVPPPPSYHRMAMEQQQQRSMPGNPSPPPQLAHVAAPSYRSSSAASQHSRMPSYGQPQPPSGLQQSNPPPQQISPHPHSAGPSPHPSLQRQSSYPFESSRGPATGYPPPQQQQQQQPLPQQPPPQQQRGYPPGPGPASNSSPYPGHVNHAGPQGPPPSSAVQPPPPNRMYNQTPPSHYYQSMHHYKPNGGPPDDRR